MNYLIRFKLFLDELDSKTYYRAIGIGSAIIALIFFLLFYWHTSRVASLEKELKKINKSREQVRELLTQHQRVQNQKNTVAEILAEDKSFKIKEEFSRVLAEMHLVGKLAKETEISESQDLASEYKEIKLGANFINMTMQELVNLLSTLDKNRRIYVKELDIKKALQSATIDVTLIIATLLEKNQQVGT